MIRLCLIITGLSTGGAETMLFKLTQSLDRNRFVPFVISLTTRGEIGPRIEALGIPVYTLEMQPGLPSPIKLLQLARLLRTLSPDVVHTWMYHADLIGGLASRLANVRSLVWCLRNSDLSKYRSKMSTRAVVHACAMLSHWLPQSIVSCSIRARNIHVDAGYCPARMHLIPNGFDLNSFMPDAEARSSVRAELGLEGNVLMVGLVARDDPQKNHLGFIEAAVRVHQVLPQARFVLAGTGIDQNNIRLTEAIDQAGLQKQFLLLGRRDDMPRLMASLDVLASSSSFGEAFPNVLGEAMACGVPCVVTDVGDSAEIVGDTGRVVSSEDMAGLARHLVELLQLPSEQRLAMGVRARDRVRANYEISDVVRRYEDFYMHLLSGSV